MIGIVLPHTPSWFIVASLLVLLSGLWIIKRHYHRKLTTSKSYSQQSWNSFQGQFFAYGFIVSLILVFLAASWTYYEPSEIEIPKIKYNMEDMGMVDQQSNARPVLPSSPPLVQPPQPIQKEVVKPIPTPQITPVPQPTNTPTPSPPISDSNPNIANNNTDNNNTNSQSDGKEKALQIVENMPLFPGCERETTPLAKEECTRRMIKEFIQQNLRYPELAIKNNVQGQVIAQFVVEKDGTISEIKIYKDIGSGTGTAAMDAVEKLNKMSEKIKPGNQGGKNVRVKYNIPINFSLRQKQAKNN
jgi:protein TonB